MEVTHTKGQENIKINNICLGGEIVKVELQKGEELITRFFTASNLIYMIDFYEKNHKIVDTKIGEEFKDYLLVAE